VLFVEPYGDAIHGFLQRADAPQPKSKEDLHGATIAVTEGHLFDRCLSQRTRCAAVTCLTCARPARAAMDRRQNAIQHRSRAISPTAT
jgi:hypothetical protein